jgi:osmotically-inducible protein OsmY
MKFLSGLIVGIIIGVLGYWFVHHDGRERLTTAQVYDTNAPPEVRTESNETNATTSGAWHARMEALDLRADEIKDELARTGKVIRHKATDFGQEVANAASDTRIVAAIKSSYAVDPNISVWKISVSCTDGHVTLSGTVAAPEDIGRAMALALNTSGVRDVVSTIQVKPPA